MVALYWVVAVWGVSSQRPVLIYLFFISLSFGSMAVVPPGVTGGLTLLGAPMTALLIIFRQFVLHRSGLDFLLGRALSISGGGLLIFLFWIWGAIVTFFVPKFLAGEVVVVPMTITGFMQTAILQPTKQNFSQFAYICISVFAIFAFAHMFRTIEMRRTALRAFLCGGVVAIVTGILDMLPIAPLLEPFRTAQYALLTETTLTTGAKRVVGLMPEASSYSGLTVGFLTLVWFLRPYLDERQKRFAGWIAGGLLVCVILSTSSGGMVALGVFAVVIAAEWIVRLHGQGTSARALIVILAGIGGGTLAVLAAPWLFDPVIERLDTMVFSKTQSESYMERSMWTRVSFQAGIDSYFIGVGLGSTRASNAAAAIFGSLGLLGVLLYYGFVLQCLTRRAVGSVEERGWLSALRWSYPPVLVTTLLAGTTPDFGVEMAFRFGLILSLTAPFVSAPVIRRSAIA